MQERKMNSTIFMPLFKNSAHFRVCNTRSEIAVLVFSECLMPQFQGFHMI